MGKKVECRLQVLVETEKSRRTSIVVMTQKYWTVEEMTRPTPGFEHFYMLIKFKSLADRKRFVKEYADGKMMGHNYLLVRYASPWKDIPVCHMKPVTDKDMTTILGPCSWDREFHRVFGRVSS